VGSLGHAQKIARKQVEGARFKWGIGRGVRVRERKRVANKSSL